MAYKNIEDKRAAEAERYRTDPVFRAKKIAQTTAWRRANRERYNASRRGENRSQSPVTHAQSRQRHLARYGLTLEGYEGMLLEQGGGCAICGLPPGTRALHVDHDHRTGEVRGLLCNNCNQGLGRFRDEPDALVAAAMYLIRTAP